jgi:tungstate transport system ATP-binding protein
MGLRKTYSKSGFTLEVDSISAPAGGTLALLGPSGSGKSTLLHLLGLLEKPDAGRVLLGDREVQAGDREARLAMAAVFQRPYLFKGTVAGNVGYGLSVRGVPKRERPERIAAALDRVGLSGYERRGAHQLSGGEAQRVSLARALVLEPKVLLLDEPLASLDVLLKRTLAEEFARILATQQVTAVYVTHDQDEAAVVADRIGVMRGGRIVAEGDPETMLTMSSDPWVAAFLGTEPPIHGVVVSAEEGAATIACGGARIVAAAEYPVGTELLVGVRPEDVLLFESGADIPATSARNRLEGSVSELSPTGVTVRVVVDVGGLRFSATVSRSSASALGLSVGVPVTILFKATAVRTRPVG